MSYCNKKDIKNILRKSNSEQYMDVFYQTYVKKYASDIYKATGWNVDLPNQRRLAFVCFLNSFNNVSGPMGVVTEGIHLKQIYKINIGEVHDVVSMLVECGDINAATIFPLIPCMYIYIHNIYV